MRIRWVVAFTAAIMVTPPAGAEAMPKDDQERACWLKHTRERTRVRLTEPTAVDVSNLRDGYTVRSPFRVDFSIRGMGVIPAGKAHPKAGHHHMLVDMTLPLNPGEKIPFNDFHRHFGKGQTGAVIALPTGKHRLRLLFADQDHRPYFVYSPEITVNVKGPRSGPEPRVLASDFDATCQVWYEEEQSRPRPEGKRSLISNLRDGEPVVSPVNLRFAVDGFGVAPKGHGGDTEGHFMLEVLRGDGGLVQTADLTNGATQSTQYLAPGNYNLRLRFVDDSGRRDLTPVTETRISVAAQERF